MGRSVSEVADVGLVRLICYPVEILGPGRRVGVWVQGCSRHCPKCVSRHTWAFDPSFALPFAQIERRLTGYAAFSDRLTISGGEPFEQPALLRRVLEVARALEFHDVLLYTGFALDQIAGQFDDVLSRVTALVDGPYQADQPTDLVWCGSANQRLHILTDDAPLHARYDEWAQLRRAQNSVQVVADRGETFIIGIPLHGAFPTET